MAIKETVTTKLGLIGSIFLPLLYLIVVIITNNPDSIIFLFGPFGFVLWVVQMAAFVIGGWVLVIVATILLLALVGYLLGRLLGWIIKRFFS